MGFLKKLGVGIKDVFGWLSSDKGQAVVKVGEAAMETAFPSLTGVINIINAWVAKAFTVEAIADAAAENTGTGAQKATILLNDLTPVVLALASQHGLPAPTAEKLATINTNVISIINLLTGATA